ncbi:hypothetical protein [Hydrogenovibrio sp. SC-1]|uniref:hypothetical protein n=1 Tax=Hydrogenovibrio sp. SC-1 TaxID=2065820 RepID=UPI000C7CE47B|nr:hypothetical protein [Hydrogenovibrio sp. SC-1]
MELAFATKELRAVCLNESLAEQKYGHDVALALRQRLAELSAISDGNEIFCLPGSPEELSDGHQLSISMNLNKSMQLILTSGRGCNASRDTTEKVNWSRVRRIKILNISQYS